MRAALAQARKLGILGVELDATGDLSPRQLSQTGRRELLRLLRSHDLELIALAAPLRRGLDSAENQQARIEHLRAILSLSFELGPGKVIVDAGRVPEKDDDPRAPFMKEALADLGRHGDKVGAQLLVETGLEAAQTLADYLARFDTGSLAACFNPGALVQNGHDPYAAPRALGRFLLHAHAADARQISPSRAQAVALGRGDLDWLQLLGALEEVDYRGWLALEAQGGAEVTSGVQFLRRLAGS